MSITSPWGPGPRSVPGAAPRCPACQHHLPGAAPSACSHLEELSPSGRPPIGSMRAAGVAVSLHPAVAASACLPSVRKLGWGNVPPSPAGLLRKGKGNWFSPPDADVPLGTLVRGGGRPWDRGGEGAGAGAGQAAAPGEAVWGRQGLGFVPFSPRLWEIMSLPAAIITDYMPFACCIKAACLINIILKGGLGMRETSCFELQ